MRTELRTLTRLFGLASCLLAGCASDGSHRSQEAAQIALFSPDKKIELSIHTRGALSYSMKVDGRPLLVDSKLGLQLRGGIVLGHEVELVKSDRRRVDAAWENPWGKRRHVRDRHNELRLTMRESSERRRVFELVFRAFDDGVGFQYVLPSQPGVESVVLERELTEFAFSGDYPCFAGQQEGGFQGAQEWEFKPGRLGSLKPEALVGLPLLIQTPAAWVALAEADLRDWAGMWLAGVPAANAGGACPTLQVKLPPRKDGQGLVKVATPHASPWRVLMVGREPGRLVESDLILNLSTPCHLADSSWVKPGKMAWDHWWSGDVQMDTATLKQYIQLAADMGWPYQLIDWQWYGPFNKPESDITKVNPAVDMDEVRRFAKERGVKLWVWLYWTDADRNDAYKRAFALYERWGMAGVKIDFMDSDHQEMVNWYEKITRSAAEHHLMVNFHGAFKTSGFNRTFPNQITREGILGNEYNRWSARVTPEHKLTLPFTRFLAGPADFTPGGFLNRQPGVFKADGKQSQVQGTRAAELALFVAYDSPLCCVCDHPNHYRNQPGADFLRIVPTVWDETRVLDGEVARHLVIARRAGDRWFLGALTDTNEREIPVRLDFLTKGKWTLRLWKDAADSGIEAEHIVTEEREVAPGDTLKIQMAPSGGCAAVLQKL
jgi:alpha-glucosidase